MLDTSDPLVQIKITQTVMVALAASVTLARLYIRRGRVWWDDACACFALLCTIIQTVAVFLRRHDTHALSRLTLVATYYPMSTAFYLIIWSARLGILLSVVRIEPAPARHARLYAVALASVLALALLLAQLFAVGEGQGGAWKAQRAPQCSLGKGVAVAQLVTDIVADSILLAAPLGILAGLQDKRLRRRLGVIFSTCVATTVVSLVHAAYLLAGDSTPIIISALVENGISLTVCSLPVVVANLFRLESPDDARTRATALRFATFRPITSTTDETVTGDESRSSTRLGRVDTKRSSRDFGTRATRSLTAPGNADEESEGRLSPGMSTHLNRKFERMQSRDLS